MAELRKEFDNAHAAVLMHAACNLSAGSNN
jgi:hypothetical protein